MCATRGHSSTAAADGDRLSSSRTTEFIRLLTEESVTLSSPLPPSHKPREVWKKKQQKEDEEEEEEEKEEGGWTHDQLFAMEPVGLSIPAARAIK